MNILFAFIIILVIFVTPLGNGALPVPHPSISADGVYYQNTRQPYDAQVCADKLAVRTGPGETYSVWSQVIKGDKLYIHERQGAWAMVERGLWVNRLGLCGDA